MATQLKKDFVYKTIKEQINSGILSSGTKIPSGLELAKNLNVSHITVRSGLKKLTQDGYIETINGRGTFVVDRNKKLAENKILVLNFNQYNELTPAHYIIPNTFNRSCENTNYTTDILDINFFRMFDQKGINEIKKRNYKAVLLNGSNYNGDEKELDILRELQLPTLLPHASKQDLAITGFSVLRIDIKAAWECGIKYLTDLSYKRIALLLINREIIRECSIDEHLKLLEKYGAISDKNLIRQIDFFESRIDDEAVYESVKELMSSANPPEVIYCYSDFFARSVYLACKKLNLSIPKDIGVMGFCGFPEASLMSPPLSTIDFNYAQIGKDANRLLVDDEIDFNNPKEFIMPHNVTVGESVLKKHKK